MRHTRWSGQCRREAFQLLDTVVGILRLRKALISDRQYQRSASHTRYWASSSLRAARFCGVLFSRTGMSTRTREFSALAWPAWPFVIALPFPFGCTVAAVCEAPSSVSLLRLRLGCWSCPLESRWRRRVPRRELRALWTDASGENMMNGGVELVGDARDAPTMVVAPRYVGA